MKYIKRIGNSGFDLIEYENYLDSEKSELARFVDDESLLSIERMSLTSRGSFHDARLLDVRVQAVDEGAFDVKIDLAGPYFDRRFHLTYLDVRTLQVDLPGRKSDLLGHEVRVESGLVCHEFLFDGEKVWTITCSKILFSEELMDNADAPSTRRGEVPSVVEDHQSTGKPARIPLD